jgi:hypothetical protein
MKNTLIYGMHWKSQERAIKKLEEENIINIKVWIGKRKYHDINIGKFRQGDLVKKSYSGLNQTIYRKIYNSSLPIFLDMFYRNPSQYIRSYQETINLYNYLFDYISQLLEDNQIELLLFYNLPHFGADYLLTVIAKELNIKMILMYQSLTANRFHYITDLDDFGSFETALTKFEYPYQRINFENKKIQFYMKNINLKYKSCHYNLFITLRRYIFRRSSRMEFLGVIKNYKDCLQFKKNYLKFAIDKVDFSQKFIYFPLQLQPELTTSTLGGIYSDQLLAIEKLSTFIPENWKIYVKENPKQLNKYREKYFFKRLSLLNNVEYIKKDVNSFELIKHCQFVATISGTAGFEAITSDKCCIIFGMAWYQKFNGIFKYSEDLIFEDIINFKIDKKKLEDDYNKFLEKTAEGIVDNGYIRNFKEYDEEENILYLTNSLTKIITGSLYV